MADPFQGTAISMDSPANCFSAVTPADGADLPIYPRFLIVGVAGNIACTDARGNSVTVPAQAGVVPIRPVRILATGTTATNIVACW